MLAMIRHALYGNIPAEGMMQAAVLSAIFFFLVGTYWQLRALKDSVFATVIGLEHMPLAKLLSVGIVSVLLVPYNALVDLVPHKQLLAVLSLAYSIAFILAAACLGSSTIGLYSTLPPSPYRLIGWVHFFLIESYGSLVVSCFWQYVNWASTYNDARAMYGLIIAGGQIGAIFGSTLVTISSTLGVPELCAFGGVLAALPVLLMRVFQRHLPSAPPGAAPANEAHKGRSGGVCEGGYLLVRYPYVMGIFAVSALHEVISTIMDYQMKVLAKRATAGGSKQQSTEEFAAFLGFFGQATTSVSFLFSVFGTSFAIRRLGLRYTLMLFPLTLMVSTVVVYLFQTKWALFVAMVSIKGLSYALNNPSKEMLYLVTSDGVKFKTKSWIDGFGNRASKAFGATVVSAFKTPLSALMFYGSLVSFGVASLVLAIAGFLGATFEAMHSQGQVIGGFASSKALIYDELGEAAEAVGLAAGTRSTSPQGSLRFAEEARNASRPCDGPAVGGMNGADRASSEHASLVGALNGSETLTGASLPPTDVAHTNGRDAC